MALIALALGGCAREKAAPAVEPLHPQRCAERAIRLAEPAVCLALPAGFEESARSKEPAFDRTTVVFERPGSEEPSEVRIVATWFANGRAPEQRERDYREALERMKREAEGHGLRLVAEAPTDDGNGTFSRFIHGKARLSRSLVRSEHWRIECQASAEGAATEEVLEACRTVSAAP